VSKLSAGNYMMESNRGRLSAGDVGSTGLWRALYLAIALLSGVGLAGKIALIRKVLPLPTPAVVMVVGVAICLPLLWPLALRIRFVLAPLAITGLLFAPLVLFPKVQQLHSVGRGTDQSDCVIVAANELTAGHWPYQQDKMWSHNPMSCGPGWVAAQAPLVKTLGYRWDLVGIWTLALAVCVWAQGWSTVSALLTLLCLCPGFWLAAANGTDCLPFGIAVTALFAATGKLRRGSVVFVVVAAILAQFRAPMLVLPAFFTKQAGRAAAIWASVLAIGTHVAFLLWNPQLYVTGGPMWLIPFPIRSYLLSLGPVVLCLAIGIPALLAAVAISLWEERSSYRWGLLAYLYAILLPPAVLNLVHKSIEYSDVIKGLGFWEGGMWIMGCLPITALVLAAVWPAPEFQVNLTPRTRFSSGASLVAPLSSPEWK
jgi:hypothetical protein